MFKKLIKKIGFKNGDTKNLLKILAGIFVVAILFGLFKGNQAQANCNGCGENDHTNSCHEGAADRSHEKVDVVFAVCVFSDGTLIDHKGANNMSDCLKTKREVEKLWRNRAEGTDSVEINGITYKIDGESLAFMCDLVDANVHRYEDGTWEIVRILGKHKKEE